jgi:hypothetical protein
MVAAKCPAALGAPEVWCNDKTIVIPADRNLREGRLKVRLLFPAFQNFLKEVDVVVYSVQAVSCFPLFGSSVFAFSKQICNESVKESSTSTNSV